MKIRYLKKWVFCVLLVGTLFRLEAQVNLQNGLVANIPLNGQANDVVNNIGTPTINGISYVNDRFGNVNGAVLFDSDSDYIKYKNPATQNIRNWTLSAWVRPDNLLGNQIIVQNGLNINCPSNAFRPDCAADGYAMGISSTNFAYSKPGFTTWIVQNVSPITIGTWYHLLVSRDINGLTKIYVNGLLTVASNDSNEEPEVPTAFVLGRMQEIAYGTYQAYRGALDDVKMYNRVLNDEEIRIISSNPSLKDNLIAYYPFNGDRKDYSGNNNHITTVSGTQFVPDRNGNAASAVSFAGGADRLSVPSSLSLNSIGDGLSISMWIKQTSANCATCPETIANYGYVLVSKQEFGSGISGFLYMSRGTINITGKRARFIAANQSNFVDREANRDFPLNKWNHLVVTYNKDTIKYYQNDTLINSVKAPLSTITSNNFNLTIGGPSEDGNNGGGFNYKGQMDEVRIYNRVLSAKEVKKLYNTVEIQLPPALCTPTTVTGPVPAPKFGFYTVNRATRNLCFVDTLGNVNIIGPTGIDPKYIRATVGSLEFDKLGNLWFSTQNDSIYTINRKTGLATLKFKLQHPYLNVSGGIYYNALSFNSKNEMYSWLEPSGPPLGRLIKVTDINTGATIALSGGTSSDIPEVFAIDFGDNDTLWTLDQCCYRKLHILSTATGLSISKSPNVLNIENVSDMDYSYGNIYGMNIVGYNSATSTGFFKTTRNGTPRSLFSLPGQYVGLAGFNQTYIDTIYVYQTVTVTSFQTVTVTSIVTVHDCGTLAGTNTGGRTDATNISVYPNPSSSKLMINYSADVVQSVDVLDIRGTIILNTHFPSSIDVATWPNGVYLLRAKDKDGIILKTFKVMKE